jgi:hypothetical protein
MDWATQRFGSGDAVVDDEGRREGRSVSTEERSRIKREARAEREAIAAAVGGSTTLLAAKGAATEVVLEATIPAPKDSALLADLRASGAVARAKGGPDGRIRFATGCPTLPTDSADADRRLRLAIRYLTLCQRAVVAPAPQPIQRPADDGDRSEIACAIRRGADLRRLGGVPIPRRPPRVRWVRPKVALTADPAGPLPSPSPDPARLPPKLLEIPGGMPVENPLARLRAIRRKLVARRTLGTKRAPEGVPADLAPYAERWWRPIPDPNALTDDDIALILGRTAAAGIDRGRSLWPTLSVAGLLPASAAAWTAAATTMGVSLPTPPSGQRPFLFAERRP